MSDLFPDPEPQAERLATARLDVAFAADTVNAALAECNRALAKAQEAQRAAVAADAARQNAEWRAALDEIEEALRLALCQSASFNKELRALLDLI